MRLSLSGAAGIGKTTLAQNLADNLSIPLIEEDFYEIIQALAIHKKPERGGSPISSYKTACQKWLKKREQLYRLNQGFVEDRCAIDVLFRLLLINSNEQDNTEIQDMIGATRRFLNEINFLILLPLSITPEAINENNLKRIKSIRVLFRANCLATGIAYQLMKAEKIIRVPAECQTVEERSRYVLEEISLRNKKAQPVS